MSKPCEARERKTASIQQRCTTILLIGAGRCRLARIAYGARHSGCWRRGTGIHRPLLARSRMSADGHRINDTAGEPPLSGFLPQPGRWRRAVFCSMIQPSFHRQRYGRSRHRAGDRAGRTERRDAGAQRHCRDWACDRRVGTRGDAGAVRERPGVERRAAEMAARPGHSQSKVVRTGRAAMRGYLER